MKLPDWIKPKPPAPAPAKAWKLDLHITGTISEIATGPPVGQPVIAGTIKNEDTGQIVGEYKGGTMIIHENEEVWAEVSPGTSPEGNPYTWPDGFTTVTWSVDDPTIALVDNIEPKNGVTARIATPKPGPLGSTVLRVNFPGTVWSEITEAINVAALASPAASVAFGDPQPEKTGSATAAKKK
jgi:hypothetical protein